MTIAAGGIIGRIRKGGDGEPAAQSEYLSDVEGDCWTLVRAEALFFEKFEQADELAGSLHCFAIVAHQPDHSLAETRELNSERSIDPPAVNGTAILAQEAIRAREKRKPRRDRVQLMKALAAKPLPEEKPENDKLWYRKEQYA